jgi:shikimate dehydrogenase
MSEPIRLTAGGLVRDGESWQPQEPFHAVVGRPVAHSLSPRIQNAALDDREIAGEYVALEVEPADLPRLKTDPACALLAGFNVTAPHKEAVAGLCDGRTDAARELGAVNTVKVEDGKWLGHNTDSGGVLTVLSQAWRDAPPPRATVLGAGGSARAAVDALARWDVAAITVLNRSAAGRERFGAWAAQRSYAARVEVAPLDEADLEPPAEPTVWVCCLGGGVPAAPHLPPAVGGTPALLLDLRYGDQLPDGAPPLGCAFVDGLPVLLMQGGLAFAWWHGPPVPWTAMQAALPAAV